MNMQMFSLTTGHKKYLLLLQKKKVCSRCMSAGGFRLPHFGHPNCCYVDVIRICVLVQDVRRAQQMNMKTAISCQSLHIHTSVCAVKVKHPCEVTMSSVVAFKMKGNLKIHLTNWKYLFVFFFLYAILRASSLSSKKRKKKHIRRTYRYGKFHL